MQYTAALIEYVIRGMISLLGITLLLSTNIDYLAIDYNKFKEVILVLTFPLAYVTGIFIDTTSSLLFNILEYRFGHLKKKFKSSDANAFKQSYEKSAEILSYSISDTIRTMESYVSRDRVARGMALNSLMVGISMILVLDIKANYPLIVACFALTITSILIRVRLKALSDSFKLKAIHKLSMRNPKDN